MRIEQLEYLAAVTQHGSLRRASEKLHLSQPALSEALTKLERELRVTLLDRRRSGARISREGRELLPYMVEVLAAVDRLKIAAGDQRTDTRVIRVGTVHAATSTLLVPAVRSFQERHPGTTVEVLTLQQAQIDEGLAEGTIDLGLVNVLDGDDPPIGLDGIDLLHGRPVAVLPAGHTLLARPQVTLDELRQERFVMMRAGYVMHRFVHRAFGPEVPPAAHSTDGAEMGKALVAEGVGVTVLPDYSVLGDPLHRVGMIEARPIAGDNTFVTLQLRQRKTLQQPLPVRELQNALAARAAEYRASRAAS
ncbi:LysR family transcriptional regulator [Pimelobacter simplex]|uniref:LysR family transcriptional regulator n=1 Tax=Nocardioides simplex TaxID=2045 RepID=A0A4Y3MZP3_NOCSI|nr:LysR family transcriptional regulator [Pimelobacter simplex]KAB2812067.1 LysR family transcriptional regulator [Pimelobacter simplex]MCG8152312.1 LysR family transcriptional regulator [Pimelobacter simplex]GEB14427.1 LysR family transcriptional regulator [Pimelobacter simplex]SFM29775.1 DNA-binding transcriptional regulator, LysR family [Pimelobacter simplex]